MLAHPEGQAGSLSRVVGRLGGFSGQIINCILTQNRRPLSSAVISKMFDGLFLSKLSPKIAS